MKVLQHEHPLRLIDLNPKYPHDEKVYDDEEDLIIKQAFQHPCDWCDNEITYLHRYYYYCDQCGCSLHKLCAELPTTLEHPSHSAHTLTLFLDESHGKCHMCKCVPWYKQLRYHCSLCMLNICLDCSMKKAQYHTLYHPSHQHPLIPLCRQILTKCDACGTEHKGVFYHCATCLSSFIYEGCVFQDKRLPIVDGTSGRLLHPHPLILAYSFPKLEQEAKFDPPCRVCENSFSDDDNLWIYKCDKCRYYVHLHCSSLIHNCSAKENISAEEYEDGPDVLHLPCTSTHQIPNRLRNFLFNVTNETAPMTLNYHEHTLILVDTQYNDTTPPMNNKVKDLCNGCVKPIMDETPFYKCTSQGCKFVLHEWCTRLPPELKDYKGHSKHSLVFFREATFYNELALFGCDVCKRICNGFVYACRKCDYIVDVACAFPHTKITHKSHPGHLLSRVMKRKDKDYCRMCLSSFRNSAEISLSCESCNFHLHPTCALSLPETIRSKYDKHPMTLSYLAIENHEGDYFCEECEEELNPNACFYHCHECVQSMHPACSPLISQNKAYILNGLSLNLSVSKYDNIKFGGIYKIEDHPHPLSFLQVTGINKCDFHKCIESKLYTDLVLKCLQCNFLIHSLCAAHHCNFL